MIYKYKRNIIILKIISIIIFMILMTLQLNNVINLSWIIITFPIWIWIFTLSIIFALFLIIFNSLKQNLFK